MSPRAASQALPYCLHRLSCIAASHSLKGCVSCRRIAAVAAAIAVVLAVIPDAPCIRLRIHGGGGRVTHTAHLGPLYHQLHGLFLLWRQAGWSMRGAWDGAGSCHATRPPASFVSGGVHQVLCGGPPVQVTTRPASCCGRPSRVCGAAWRALGRSGELVAGQRSDVALLSVWPHSCSCRLLCGGFCILRVTLLLLELVTPWSGVMLLR
jgi:hypothetical protein